MTTLEVLMQTSYHAGMSRWKSVSLLGFFVGGFSPSMSFTWIRGILLTPRLGLDKKQRPRIGTPSADNAEAQRRQQPR